MSRNRACVCYEPPCDHNLMRAIRSRLRSFGFGVDRTPNPESQVLAFVWNGKGWGFRDQVPTVCVERGWVPRSTLQMGLGGINATHHRAGERPPTLDARTAAETAAWLRSVRLGDGGGGRFAHSAPSVSVAEDLPEQFILVPLQDDSDTNMAFAPPQMKTSRTLIRWIVAQQLPFPVVFKSHPARRAQSEQLGAQPLRDQDLLCHGPIHGFLKHPGCQAVVTVNSNTANDALLWDVPVIALGRGIWPQDGPFYSSLPSDWPDFLERARDEKRQSRIEYASWLRSLQWEESDLGELRFLRFVAEVLSR